MDDIKLNGTNKPAQLGKSGIELIAPGLTGTVFDMEQQSMFESVEMDPMLAELRNTDVKVAGHFEIEVEAEPLEDLGLESARVDHGPKTRLGEAAIVLNVPAPNIEEDMAILYTDEAGAHRWILPEKTRSAAGQLTFHLPKESTPVDEEEDMFESTRGRWFKIGKRIVRVLKWVAVKVIGHIANFIARFFERDKYALFTLPFGDNGSRNAVNWDHMTGGTALLLCHGTISSTENSFRHLLPSNEFGQLLASYQQRIFAFDHPTLSQTPEDNVKWLLENLPKEKPLHINLLTTSRGGLIAREFLHRLPELNNNGWDITVDKFVMSACPNRGTPLADPKSIPDFLDRYTNLLMHVPIPAISLINRILELIKLLARGIVDGLPGLQAMRPGNEFLQKINSMSPAPGTALHALSADFNPGHEGLRRIWSEWLDQATDRIFKEKNDGVVPTEGAHMTGIQSAGFPISSHYSRSGDAHHLSYFLYEDMRQQAKDWLLEPVFS